MKWIYKTFHFLGGLYFAITLIAIMTLCVITGTFLESRYDSHLFAAQWTYGHPLFSVLLGFLFINILFSAMRRWPFQIRHIPFLTTHLGLLMIIAGCMIKQKYGVQGNMIVTEGSSSHQISIPHSYALQVQKKNSERLNFPLSLDRLRTYTHPSIPDFQFKVVGYSPHSTEKIETWFKRDQIFIMGFPPLPVLSWPQTKLSFIQADLPTTPSLKCNLIALRTNKLQDALEAIYLNDIRLKIVCKEDAQYNLDLPLAEAIASPQTLYKGIANISLDISYSTAKGFQAPVIKLIWKYENRNESLKVPLQGNNSLYSVLENQLLNESPLFEIDLVRENPVVAFIEDEDGDNYVFALDNFGRVHGEVFKGSNLKSMVIYDQGFGGYTAQASLPFSTIGRKEKEKFDFEILSAGLKQAMQSNPVLAPPLQMLKSACDKAQVDFTTTFLNFIMHWHQTHQLLMPKAESLEPNLKTVLSQFEWNQQHLQACRWISLLFDRLDEPYKKGDDLQNYMKVNKWPFVSDLIEKQKKDLDVLTALAQQMLEFSNDLPEVPEIAANDPARLYSAFLKAYGIEYHNLQSLQKEGEEDFAKMDKSYAPIQLQTPLTPQHMPKEPLTKLEDNCPCILIETLEGDLKSKNSLAYDALGNGLRWPILEGKYLIHFQQLVQDTPYRVRLHQARQINYPDSQQPYSYESDITIYPKGDKDAIPIEKTLSMNHVYETWEGYRFYLAGMTSQTSGLKRIQVVVNYDPAKYYLTYPGGLITSLGIILLLWMRPYQNKKK